MKTTKTEAKRELPTTGASDVEASFQLPDLTKKPVGLRVRSHVKAGLVARSGDPETM